jgi:hypothetical protein
MIGILIALFVSTAEAGAPPPEVIPWDSVVVVDTLAEGVIDPHWVHFITRDKYESEVLGWEFRSDVRDVKRDIEKIKKLLKAKKAKHDP